MMAWMSCLEVGYLRALVDSNAVQIMIQVMT